jgi:hypothetical protein
MRTKSNQSQPSLPGFFASSAALFSRSFPSELTQEFKQSLDKLLGTYTDCTLFQHDSLSFIKKFGDESLVSQWEAFIVDSKHFSAKKAEQLLLLKLAFQSFFNPVKPKELAQLVDLATELKNEEGWYLLCSYVG